MIGQRARTLLLLAMTLGATAAAALWTPAHAQGLQVVGDQDLNFGELLTGIPTTVTRTDALNSGQIIIRGPRGTDIEVTLLLPNDLVGPGGATIPVSFPPGSAGFAPFFFIFFQQAFDPNVPNTFSIGFFGQVAIYLGGTATAPLQSPAGVYSSTVTAIVANLNN